MHVMSRIPVSSLKGRGILNIDEIIVKIAH